MAYVELICACIPAQIYQQVRGHDIEHIAAFMYTMHLYQAPSTSEIFRWKVDHERHRSRWEVIIPSLCLTDLAMTPLRRYLSGNQNIQPFRTFRRMEYIITLSHKLNSPIGHGWLNT